MTERQPTIREIRAAMVAKGANAEELDEFDCWAADFRNKLESSMRADDARANVKALRNEQDALATAAEHQKQDLEAAERRAAPLLAQAEELVTPYRNALSDTARRRAAIAQRLEAAEAELVQARDAEREALLGQKEIVK